MCGRFSLTVSDIAALARAWGAEVDALLLQGWHPRYNVAPGHLAPLLRGPAGQRRLVLAAFGLAGPGGKLLINARGETAAARPAFRAAMAGGRAVVPADGFFEWEGPPSARRPTWFHRPDGAPLLLAAVAVPGPDGHPAFAILTTGAVAPVARLHDRMPVILPEAALDSWLADGPPPPLPAPDAVPLAGRPVSPRVNSPANDDPGCLESPPAPAQGTLFP
jgi:putative SOS response-associated peptidase YedK